MKNVLTNLKNFVFYFQFILEFDLNIENKKSFFCSGKMATQSQGIQQLLAAEKKAAEIVSEARKSKQAFNCLI
jgi:hypothetical protein